MFKYINLNKIHPFKAIDFKIFDLKSPSDQAVVLDGSEVEHVREFVFHGSVVPNSDDNGYR